MNILFVVHRYAPFQGGSEIYVQNMAEETLRRGHSVAVFSGEHKGNLNGITVTSDSSILLAKWDLIVVHGGGVAIQDFVLANANKIESPILYMLILPNDSEICVRALNSCELIGCSTYEDFDHCAKYNVLQKSVQVRHGINPANCWGSTGFKEKYGLVGKKMFLSCGGYWPNKAMKELADIFTVANLPNSVLVTTGYDNRFNLMPPARSNVMPLLLDDRTEMLSALYDADCLLMHSKEEGFGLVLLEAMLNQTPWIARRIAGAKSLINFGQTYESDAELLTLLRKFDRNHFNIKAAYEHVASNHLISNTVDDIENAARLTSRK
jgi:glycosyltransferase involved in cell wall biosynthesis